MLAAGLAPHSNPRKTQHAQPHKMDHPMTPAPDNPTRWSQLDPARLARLLEMNTVPDPPASWGNSAAILRHQLAAPLLPDLLIVPGAQEHRLRQLINARPGVQSFADQLTHLYPSQELLEAIKNFARQVRDDPANPLHGAPANALYFAAIAAALLRCDIRISKLSNTELREGFTWASQQPGAHDLVPVLRDATQKMPA
jgi:hypothetical protein